MFLFLQDYPKAKTFYEKSLSEHRTPETKEILSKVSSLNVMFICFHFYSYWLFFETEILFYRH